MRGGSVRDTIILGICSLVSNNPVFAAIFAVLAIGAAIMLFYHFKETNLHTERGLNTVQEGLGLKEWHR